MYVYGSLRSVMKGHYSYQIHCVPCTGLDYFGVTKRTGEQSTIFVWVELRDAYCTAALLQDEANWKKSLKIIILQLRE